MTLTNLWHEYKAESQCGAKDYKHSSNGECCILVTSNNGGDSHAKNGEYHNIVNRHA